MTLNITSVNFSLQQQLDIMQKIKFIKKEFSFKLVNVLMNSCTIILVDW